MAAESEGLLPTIRRCSRGDLPAVVDLFRQDWPGAEAQEAPLYDAFERGLASPRQRYLCAEVDSRVVGFGSLTLNHSLRQGGPVGRLEDLVVDRNYRCQGIATRLLQAIEAIAIGAGCSRLDLDCAFHRKEEHAFFEQRRYERKALLFSKQLS
ncbi:MAG TPA: GNAT family N-acetyltransferase [Myxococcales bacterium]|nr:GNAT family N-acetyltransferase [Myxococcales bacterium]